MTDEKNQKVKISQLRSVTTRLGEKSTQRNAEKEERDAGTW